MAHSVPTLILVVLREKLPAFVPSVKLKLKLAAEADAEATTKAMAESNLIEVFIRKVLLL
ncbi:MAG: hypothetical protein DM484_00145 [Candidatus Methylumidiphilus alinenensis]|uniref:Uncharacterized protein n=1 Tax=Candidatus Methylumidiphilus alinenensis TaxID=2202197 RepID=A0A2W4S9H9_9GAMM|nr:MAG: hypothetical protein DM484_00145 [Candidatus Methylumidiphilus alinenensis]